ncbi:MAG: hypothetical protein OEX02_19710, partial [Cyclobacteriaceae bacterium]|nr:hypothetical protein [Cyclobacteriaceae bacterium]
DATATNNDLRYPARGEFIVDEIQVEYMNLTADFNLMRKLSRENNGKYFHINQAEQLENELTPELARGIIHTHNTFKPLIQWEWVFVLFLVLFTTEWFLRKYYGTY